MLCGDRGVIGIKATWTRGIQPWSTILYVDKVLCKGHRRVLPSLGTCTLHSATERYKSVVMGRNCLYGVVRCIFLNVNLDYLDRRKQIIIITIERLSECTVLLRWEDLLPRLRGRGGVLCVVHHHKVHERDRSSTVFSKV